MALASVAEAKSPVCKLRGKGNPCTVPVVPPPSNGAPTISGTPATSVTTGQSYSFTPTASDPDGNTLTFNIVNPPPWASFSSSTGRLSGTPSSSSVGNYIDIRISVSDGQASASLAPFSIVVSQANRPPTISGSPPTTAREGQAYAFTPSANDADGDTLSFSITNRPAWASFNAATGALTGTPATGAVGTYADITIRVSDGTATVSLSAFSITVAAANQPPVIGGSPATSGREGIAYSFTPIASDPDGNSMAFSVSNKPSWASFSASNGRLSGTPPVGSAGSYAGIVISVSDGSLSASLPAFTINVAANRAPIISGTPATSVTTGQAYSFTPTASDPDGNTLTFSIVNRPLWASFSTSTGRLSGTPASSSVGEYIDIRISVSDGQATASLAPFSITVAQANRAPTIAGTPATTIVEGQAYSFTPTASDPDGDPLSFSITNQPSWATFSTSSGNLSGTPGTGTVGTYSNIQITVSDGTLQASLAAFSITVQQAANGSATLTWTPPTTRTDGSPLTNLAGYRLRYGNSSGNYPNLITISNPGLTTYMVQNLAVGTYFFVLAAYDATGSESVNTNPVSKTIN